MKKWILSVMAACLVFALAVCGAESENWVREGFFEDENGYMLSVSYMDDVDEPGWYVGCMLGDDMMNDAWGGILPQEGETLHGVLPAVGDQDDLTVTVSEEGEDGVMLSVEEGETYHFTPMEMQEATIMVTIGTEGWGNIAYAEDEEDPAIDPEYPFQSATINLAEPATYTIAAWPQAGYVFVKWTRDGEDFSTEPRFTVLLDDSADFVAWFEEDPDWQNPVMNFIGEYQCDRAHAVVECFGAEDAWITIEWGGSARELAHWDILGRLDLETLTINYTGSTKQMITYGEDGEVENVEVDYEDGTGTITFREDGSFIWHDDQSEYEEDMVFEWLPVTDDVD